MNNIAQYEMSMMAFSMDNAAKFMTGDIRIDHDIIDLENDFVASKIYNCFADLYMVKYHKNSISYDLLEVSKRDRILTDLPF